MYILALCRFVLVLVLGFLVVNFVILINMPAKKLRAVYYHDSYNIGFIASSHRFSLSFFLSFFLYSLRSFSHIHTRVRAAHTPSSTIFDLAKETTTTTTTTTIKKRK